MTLNLMCLCLQKPAELEMEPLPPDRCKFCHKNTDVYNKPASNHMH